MLRTKLATSVAALGLVAGLVLGAGAPAEAASPKITMVIKSSTHSRADMSWYSNFNSASLKDHATPYVKVVSTAGYIHSISASNYSGDEVSLTCVIKYRGKVVKKHTVTGSDVRVNCEFRK